MPQETPLTWGRHKSLAQHQITIWPHRFPTFDVIYSIFLGGTIMCIMYHGHVEIHVSIPCTILSTENYNDVMRIIRSHCVIRICVDDMWTKKVLYSDPLFVAFALSATLLVLVAWHSHNLYEWRNNTTLHSLHLLNTDYTCLIHLSQALLSLVTRKNERESGPWQGWLSRQSSKTR
jgi:hypothetical protein